MKKILKKNINLFIFVKFSYIQIVNVKNVIDLLQCFTKVRFCF